MHQNDPILADAFFQFGRPVSQVHILVDHLSQQLPGRSDLLAFRVSFRQGCLHFLRQCHQALGIDHDSLQEHPAALLVIPVYLDLPLEVRLKVALERMCLHPGFQLLFLGRREPPAQLLDAVPQQVVGVLHRSPPQDVGRVQDYLQPPHFQVPRLFS